MIYREEEEEEEEERGGGRNILIDFPIPEASLSSRHFTLEGLIIKYPAGTRTYFSKGRVIGVIGLVRAD